MRECATIKTDLDRADLMMDDHKAEFERRWQQEVVRLKTEQAVFSDQALELVALKSELRHLLVIAQQLEPYIRSEEGAGHTVTMSRCHTVMVSHCPL